MLCIYIPLFFIKDWDVTIDRNFDNSQFNTQKVTNKMHKNTINSIIIVCININGKSMIGFVIINYKYI